MVPEGLKFTLFCASGLPQENKSSNLMPEGVTLKIKCQKVLFDIIVKMKLT